MDEHIRMIKQQAFHEGFIAGYQRGIEDSRAGGQVPPSLLDSPLQFLNLSSGLSTVWTGQVIARSGISSP